MESATMLIPPSTSLSGISSPSEPNIPEGPEYEKISTLYDIDIERSVKIFNWRV